jgi:hypothetical protein
VLSSLGGGTGFRFGSALTIEDTVFGRSTGDRGGLSGATGIMVSSAMATLVKGQRNVFAWFWATQEQLRDVKSNQPWSKFGAVGFN